jgi:hypothetical protein
LGKRASAIAFMLGLSFFGSLFALAVLGERTTLGFRASSPALSPLSPGTEAPPVEVAGPPPAVAPEQPEPFEPVPILVPPTPRPEPPAEELEQADEAPPPEAPPSPPPAPEPPVDEPQPKAPTTKELAAEKLATEEPAVEEPATEDDDDGGPAHRKGKTHTSTKKDGHRGTKGKGGTKKEKSVHATGEEQGKESGKGKTEEPKPAEEKP